MCEDTKSYPPESMVRDFAFSQSGDSMSCYTKRTDRQPKYPAYQAKHPDVASTERSITVTYICAVSSHVLVLANV